MRLINRKTRYYTGDTMNPLVSITRTDGFPPENATVKLIVKKPADSTGNILSQRGLISVSETDGDSVTPLYATLQLMEREQGRPVITYTEETIELFDDASHDDGGMEPDGIFGNPLKDLFRHAGNYTFHALAMYGDECTGTRELTWSVHVDIGIDAGQTTVQTDVIATQPDGRQQVRIVFTPRDRYGNLTGPGRLDGFIASGIPGSVISGDVRDMNNGNYEVIVIYHRNQEHNLA